MEENVTGSASRMGKRPSESGMEVDYKNKAGTAWSHNFLNQKPWHPLSYPNQRRKWIAEQTHAQRERRSEEVAREFAQEQEFFQQTSLFSKKEKEKVEIMQAVSFMYVRPPGYNAESAKAAEIADEQKRLGQTDGTENPTKATNSTMPDIKSEKDQPGRDKKARPKDVFGRPLPTEEEFEVLKNAPRLETGVPVRIKPFGVEIRNVRCLRCGTFGHQSGDRECPLKDAIMPNEESRLRRDDPLTTIMAQTNPTEPLKWELKQKPGISPPRGGFQADDPNQQIVAEDIFDEYGGFLSGGEVPALLSTFPAEKSKKHSKHKHKHKHRTSAGRQSEDRFNSRQASSSSDSEIYKESRKQSSSKHKQKHRPKYSESSVAELDVDSRRRHSKAKHKLQHYSELLASSDSESGKESRRRSKKKHEKSLQRKSSSSSSHRSEYSESTDSELELDRHRRQRHPKGKHVMRHYSESSSSSDSESGKKQSRRRSMKHEKSHRTKCASSSDNRRRIDGESNDKHLETRHKKRYHRGSSPSPDSDTGGRSRTASKQKLDSYEPKHHHHQGRHRHHHRHDPPDGESNDKHLETRHKKRYHRGSSPSPDPDTGGSSRIASKQKLDSYEPKHHHHQGRHRHHHRHDPPDANCE